MTWKQACMMHMDLGFRVWEQACMMHMDSGLGFRV